MDILFILDGLVSNGMAYFQLTVQPETRNLPSTDRVASASQPPQNPQKKLPNRCSKATCMCSRVGVDGWVGVRRSVSVGVSVCVRPSFHAHSWACLNTRTYARMCVGCLYATMHGSSPCVVSGNRKADRILM